MQAVSRSRKLRTDLRIVSSGRSFHIDCTAAFRSARFYGLGFSVLKLTRIIYYNSVSQENKTLCHNDVLRKVVVSARVSLIKPIFVQLRNSFLKFAFASFWR